MNKILEKHIPKAAVPLVIDLLNKYPHRLKVVNKRETKHGDFRLLKNRMYQITVNINLNKYQFLLTLIHEIAHLVTHLNHKRARPHGKEWKQTFQHLMLPFIHPEIYPKEILSHLANYLKNPKASTDSDVKLALAMKQFSEKSDKNFIFEIPLGSDFIFKNRIFRKGNKRRTRHECLELKTKKLYLFNQNAEVELVIVK
ncbi:MAG: sprT domain-containing protein [Lutibacter sp.]|nr:MAG: sprT domain-containing protein [Lutibacter sp.]